MENKKSNKAKKSLLVIAIALMMALVIGMGAFTYSKYIASYNVPAQSATAAKWGIVITADATKLFGTDYTLDTTDSSSNTLATVTDNGVAVKAFASTGNPGNIVAPGTSGSMTITINGVTDVLAKLSLSVTGVTDTSGTVTDATDIYLGDDPLTAYYPIKWTLSGGSDDQIDKKLSDLTAISEYIDAGTNLTNKTYTLSWEWAFDNNDTNDTILGLVAAGKTDEATTLYGATLPSYSTTISFVLTVSVEQVQTKPTT